MKTLDMIGYIRKFYINKAIHCFAHHTNSVNNHDITHMLYSEGYKIPEIDIIRELFMIIIERQELGKDKPADSLDQVQLQSRQRQEDGC